MACTADHVGLSYLNMRLRRCTHGGINFIRGETNAIDARALGGDTMRHHIMKPWRGNIRRFYLQYSFRFSLGQVEATAP